MLDRRSLSLQSPEITGLDVLGLRLLQAPELFGAIVAAPLNDQAAIRLG